MVEAALGAEVLLLAAAVAVDEVDSTEVSVTVDEPAGLDTVDGIVVVTILEVDVMIIDVAVLVRVGGDAVSTKTAVNLAVPAESSDRAEESSEAIFELALSTAALADSVAMATAELARATTLLASEAAPFTTLAASELASCRALRISDAFAEMAAEADAALVSRADSASLIADTALVGIGIGTGMMVTPFDSMLDAKAATDDWAAEAAETT